MNRVRRQISVVRPGQARGVVGSLEPTPPSSIKGRILDGQLDLAGLETGKGADRALADHVSASSRRRLSREP